MEILIPQFEPFKDQIPQFVIKLYHILEQPEYSEYLCWNGDSEVLIKQPKRLEDKVLPHFFRHRHLSSFVRQLNMYKFSKIIKLVKEKNYMYFRNQHFHRGHIRDLTKIKRNVNKKSKRDTTTLTLEEPSEAEKSESISIDHHIEEEERNIPLIEYRKIVHNSMKEIVKLLKKVEASHPEIKEELGQSISKCNELLDQRSDQQNLSLVNLSQEQLNRGMIQTMRFMPMPADHFMFPSQSNL